MYIKGKTVHRSSGRTISLEMSVESAAKLAALLGITCNSGHRTYDFLYDALREELGNNEGSIFKPEYLSMVRDIDLSKHIPKLSINDLTIETDD